MERSSLFKHQKDIIDNDPKKCGLFLGTGSSKTRIALELAKGKILVICPKTQAEDQNWQRENKKWKINKNITVISKETFRRDATELPRFDTVIVDEAHTCLGVTPNTRQRKRIPIPKASQLFEALDWYVQFHKPERIYLCTATIIKSPMTVWAAAKILDRIPADDYMMHFLNWRDNYYTKLPMPGREVYSPKHDAETKNKLARNVRLLGYTGRLEDYFDVPDQTYRTIHIPLTVAQKARVRELSLEYPDPLVLIGKKHQVENGVLSGDEFRAPEFFPNEKIEKILELAEEFPRIVIFAKYTAQIAAIENALRKAKKPVLTLTGATKDRQNAFKEAKKRLNCAFICQAQISAGWELPEFPVMIFASMSYSFVDRVQAEGRIQRANHIKKNLYIDLVVKGGVDEAVQKAIHNKKDFDERIYAKI
jgi:hypothetical protein